MILLDRSHLVCWLGVRHYYPIVTKCLHSADGRGLDSPITLPTANIAAGRYVYISHLTELEACTEHDDVIKWPTCPTPIRLSSWVPFLLSHPDHIFASYVYQGLKQGFRICFRKQGSGLRHNHPSALANPAVIQTHIDIEQEAGRLVGPLPQSVVPLVHTNPIGLVPKSHQVDKWRMIVDLSSPTNRSVNDGISKDLCSLAYASVDDAVERILRLGRAKLDIQSAYRIVPVHPQDQHLLAITWDGKTYVDRALPLGLRSAPKIFTAVPDMIAWALHCCGIQHQIHYLDDFLFLSLPEGNSAKETLAVALRILLTWEFPYQLIKRWDLPPA